jgi:hypothetical protein
VTFSQKFGLFSKVFRILFLEKKLEMSKHTGRRGGYEPMSHNDKGGRGGGVKNQSKKCYLNGPLEWAL